MTLSSCRICYLSCRDSQTTLRSHGEHNDRKDTNTQQNICNTSNAGDSSTMQLQWLWAVLALLLLQTLLASHSHNGGVFAAPVTTPKLGEGINTSIYCSMCTRIVEEVHLSVGIKQKKAAAKRARKAATAAAADPLQYTDNIKRHIGQMIDKSVRAVLLNNYAVSESGSLIIDKRHFRSLVQPVWLMGVGKVPPAGFMPDEWQAEVSRTYDLMLSTQRDAVVAALQTPTATPFAQLCIDTLHACPLRYTFPARDLAPLGNERVLGPDETIRRAIQEKIDDDDEQSVQSKRKEEL